MTTAAPPLERADGVDLLGALGGSGYKSSTFLVRRRDGQTLQITALLYTLLEQLDGQRDQPALAEAMSAATDRHVTSDNVEALLSKLASLGLLHGTEPEELPKSNPLLALRWKVVVSDPAVTNRITAPFAALFAPWILWPVLVAFVGVCWFVLVDKGLASATHQAFTSPGLLLAVFALTVLSAGFHELGHAAACRYGGARPGAMGAGLYLVWPAFYTDVDDSYRLGRRGRLRVDLGGLYFNALVAVVVTGAWWVTRQDALLLGVATQLLQMVRQLAPVVRADGYHILADLTGVPDLFAHLLPTVKRVLPSNWGTPSPLTRRARLIVTAWVLVVVPVLLSLMATAILLLPRLLATAWTSGQVQLTRFGTAAEHGDLLGVGAVALKVLALVLPVLGASYITMRVVRTAAAAVWRKTDGRPFSRGAATALAAVLLVVLVWTWWPSGQYTPISGRERGTIPSFVSSASSSHAAPLRSATRLGLVMVPRGGITEAHPALIVTSDKRGPRAVLTATGHDGVAFPFALPRQPGPGDTQAVTVNTKDGSALYDVAYALITVTDDSPVLNKNSAYALASCHTCTTVSVSFQIVLIVGKPHVIAPINAAVAGNAQCVECLTTALAVQLVATVNSLPTAETRAQLQAALAKLDNIQGMSEQEVLAQVQAVQNEATAILQNSGAIPVTDPTSVATPATEVTSDPSASPDPTASADSTPSPTATPTSPAPTDSPTASPTTEPTATSSP
ncbi:MAG: Tat (Twin-arginine translocation) pathway signal sequence domain protein [Frankiales bacterium]|nr:Tat (Twin-arginine translocation) pathway signal sequence domain protein [Frankiales bacterium]